MKAGRVGFTLIELLVVIAIIAILAAILFPVFKTAKEKSHQTVCANNMRQIVTAIVSYADDNNGMIPGLNLYSMRADGLPAPPDEATMGGAITPYLKTWDVLCCPADPLHKYSAARIAGKPGYVKLRWTYTLNGYMTREDPYVPGNSKDVANRVGVPMSYSKQPSKTILLVDENTDPSYQVAEWIVNDAVFINEDRTTDRHPGGSGRAYKLRSSTGKSEGFANVCYLDNHIRTLEGMLQWNEHPNLFRR